MWDDLARDVIVCDEECGDSAVTCDSWMYV